MLSSPSGGGKSTIARHLLEAREDVTYSVSATTRPMRVGEEDGREYHFLARPEFQRRVAAGEFAEWAEYGGNLYGTLRSEVERGLGAGRHVVSLGRNLPPGVYLVRLSHDRGQARMKATVVR